MRLGEARQGTGGKAAGIGFGHGFAQATCSEHEAPLRAAILTGSEVPLVVSAPAGSAKRDIGHPV
jgi:hypothetical protein